MDQVTVDVKSAWLSKINWTQAIGIIASVLVVVTGGKVNLDLATQAQLVLAIQSVAGVLTWAFKTFGKPTATPSAAAKV